MESSLTDRVRNTCETVAGLAEKIKIRYEIIPAYAASLPVEKVVSPEHDPSTHYLGRGDGTAAFFLTLDAINFGSGWFPHLAKRPGKSGYFTVAASLNDRFRSKGPLSVEELSKLTAGDCADIFGQDAENSEAFELMGLFSEALNDLGQYIVGNFGGSFMRLIGTAGGSAERLAELLIKMPLFNDVERYGDLDVEFHKRAQLTAADLSVAGICRFTDLDRLTIFADNLVPHVLRVDGILEYDSYLAGRIDSEEPIPPGSPEEIEIRACALHAVELIKKAILESGKHVTSYGLDFLLWNRGQQPFYKARPRHRARTVFY